jgi:DNA-binding SARP family transcriptional activator
MTLRVRTLGALELDLDGAELPPPAGRPARTLLAWLALHPGAHLRSAVAAALWPDVLDESARASLRTALSAVRRALGPASPALRADRERVELGGDVAIDLRDFERLLDSGELDAALELARGELLPDLDDDWVLRRRDRHRERWGAALATMARAAADAEEALAWARRGADLDPFDEAAQRELMTALAATGETASALAVYDRLQTRMRRELGLVPSSASRDLAAALRAGQSRQAAQLPLPPRLRPERSTTPFVGRTAALARLAAIRAALVGGGVRFAVVVGEPGIGKSRLAATFAGELHAAGDTVLAGRSPREPGEPLVPLLEALGEAAPHLEEPSDADTRAGRLRLNDALADRLEHAAAGRPLLLVLDDLQWADGATLDVLRHLAGRRGSTPALVVATARPGTVVSALVEELEATRIELAGLTVAETEALLAGRGEAHDADALVRRTGGNPFFLEALLEAGDAEELSAGIAELVAARVGSLGEPVRRLLEAAAVLGQELDTALLARVSGGSLDETLEALDEAAAARVLVPAADGVGRVAFAHALVREALAQTLPPARRARLHAQALEALRPRADAGSEDALVAAAAHAIAAAPLVDEEQVATLAERAAAALSAAYAAGDAARLLELAVQAVREPTLLARLGCALGEALQRADRVPEADAAFDRAADAARRLGDGVVLARAALGLAGAAVTILSVDRERVALLEEALAGLALDRHELRSRLQSRLAIELAYDGDADRRERISIEAVEAARATGDARATAAALGARHVVLWGPDHTSERLGLADEMLASARRAGDAVLELQARTWRIVDLDELGDGAALEAELDAYADTAARARLTAYAWWVPAWRSARAYLAGRVAEGDRLRRRAVELGRRAGDRNVDFARLVHWVMPLADGGIRLVELDLDWHRERIRSSPAGWAYRSMYAWVLAATGNEGEARRELASQRSAVGTPSSWPRDTNWLSAAKELSEAAVLLGDRGLAAELETLLEPFADRMVVSARALLCMGSVSGALGRLADLRGDRGLAAERYTRAVEREERAGALVWAMHHRLRLGQALVAAGDGDGRTVLAAVAADAPALGLGRLAEDAARAARTRARAGARR